MITFGGGTVICGFGSVSYKVMVYDIAAAGRMKAYIDHVIAGSEHKTQLRFDKFEQTTTAKLENLKLWTKSEFDSLQHLIELAVQKGK
ncbi:hypothetical protein L873DRAFT_1820638 [Choiromyces venosus 120613-1]|uniref:Uncharacterized protein n=1 Tax=Choiromyces venosus 120613-1 TaxID=1336337 RepID=A0A3N4J2C0_9PEZI|nr:hypothetical protein L873DRAFT_1820638 [Choiromyces venosus 120613-1]